LAEGNQKINKKYKKQKDKKIYKKIIDSMSHEEVSLKNSEFKEHIKISKKKRALIS
jgi:nucleoside diphosphate kinase